jgi:epoxyqueuosine reductase QueG
MHTFHTRRSECVIFLPNRAIAPGQKIQFIKTQDTVPMRLVYLAERAGPGTAGVAAGSACASWRCRRARAFC